MATNKKTVFVNIISTDIPIGLRNWDVKEKYIYQTKTRNFKKNKKSKDVVLTVSEKYKKYLYKNFKKSGVCN